MIERLTNVYCSIDDFIYTAQKSPQVKVISKKSRGTKPRLALSEILTIIVTYHLSNFKNFKSYYLFLLKNHRTEFPNLVSYNRFLELKPMVILPLTAYLYSRFGKPTESNFIDSTKIQVCKNKRISRNKVFNNIGKLGKSTMGWFFGFKLHLVINQNGELLSASVSKGNMDDRIPVPKLLKNIKGNVYADKGYIGKELFQHLYKEGTKLITGIKSNMKNKMMDMHEKLMLRKRSIIETVNDVLKNCCDCEHSRHRSPANFCVNLIAGLIAYTHREKLPSIKGFKSIKVLA